MTHKNASFSPTAPLCGVCIFLAWHHVSLPVHSPCLVLLADNGTLLWFQPASPSCPGTCEGHTYQNMHRSKAFFKKTRKGKILRVVSDHYLRDDIGCGSLAGKPVSNVSAETTEYLHCRHYLRCLHTATYASSCYAFGCPDINTRG